jgi:hypothetical protein
MANSHADDQGAQVPRRFFAEMPLRCPAEDTDPQQSGDGKAEDDDERPADPSNPVAVIEQESAGRAEGRPERDEDQREPCDERRGVKEHSPPCRRREVGAQIGHRHAGGEGEVRRKQWQYAG